DVVQIALSRRLPASTTPFPYTTLFRSLIESFLDGMEVSVGVIRYKGKTTVVGITEIVSHNDFFDYEAKYEGASEEITPARIDEEDRKSTRLNSSHVRSSHADVLYKKEK